MVIIMVIILIMEQGMVVLGKDPVRLEKIEDNIRNGE